MLYYPKPREYKEYTDREVYEKADAFFERLQKKYVELEPAYAQYKPAIEKLLHRRAEVEEYQGYYEKADFVRLVYMFNDFAAFDALYSIAIKEKQLHVPVTLLHFQDLSALEEGYHRLMFGLHRGEFGMLEDMGAFLSDIKEGKVSPVCIGELLGDQKIIQKKQAALHISQLLEQEHMVREALLILNMVLQREEAK